MHRTSVFKSYISHVTTRLPTNAHTETENNDIHMCTLKETKLTIIWVMIYFRFNLANQSEEPSDEDDLM